MRTVLEAKTRLDKVLYFKALEMAPGKSFRNASPMRASGPCYALRDDGVAGAGGLTGTLAGGGSSGGTAGVAAGALAAGERPADTPAELAAWDALLEAAAKAGRGGNPAPSPGQGFYGEWSNRSAPFDSWGRCRRPGAGVGGGEVHVAACVASAPSLGVSVLDHEERIAEWILRCAVGLSPRTSIHLGACRDSRAPNAYCHTKPCNDPPRSFLRGDANR